MTILAIRERFYKTVLDDALEEESDANCEDEGLMNMANTSKFVFVSSSIVFTFPFAFSESG